MCPDRHVLVVEDDVALREALALILEVEGYHAVPVADGKAALDYLRSHPPPCLVLLDLKLPVLDGRELLKEREADPVLRRTPFVVLSAAEDAQQQAAQFHAAGFIQKPVDAQTVLATVRLFAARPTPGVLLVGGHDELREVIPPVLRRHGLEVFLARTGPEALDLLRQQRGRVALVLLDAHTRGVTGPELVDELHAIEPGVRCCFLNHDGVCCTPEPAAGHETAAPLPTVAEIAQLLRQLA